MRCIPFLCAFLFFISCSSEKKNKKPDWLQGKWIRTNNEEHKTTYEFWDADFNGLGFTLQDRDTVFVEKMNILSNEGKMYLQVIGMGEIPTLFTFTKQNENSFVAENKQNQFPKKIKYFVEKDTLKAVISNDDFSVDFKFSKLKK